MVNRTPIGRAVVVPVDIFTYSMLRRAIHAAACLELISAEFLFDKPGGRNTSLVAITAYAKSIGSKTMWKPPSRAVSPPWH